MTTTSCNALITAVENLDEATVRGFAIDLARYQQDKASDNLALFSWLLKNPGVLAMVRDMRDQDEEHKLLTIIKRN